MTQARIQTQMNSGLSALSQLLLAALAFACVEPVRNLLSAMRALLSRPAKQAAISIVTPAAHASARPTTPAPLIPAKAGIQIGRSNGLCSKSRQNPQIHPDHALRRNEPEQESGQKPRHTRVTRPTPERTIHPHPA